jgi:hypothetical protein
MHQRQRWTQCYNHIPAFEYATVSTEGPLPPEQRATYESQGWTLFGTCGPVSDTDRRHDSHFKRPITPHYLRVCRRADA